MSGAIWFQSFQLRVASGALLASLACLLVFAFTHADRHYFKPYGSLDQFSATHRQYFDAPPANASTYHFTSASVTPRNPLYARISGVPGVSYVTARKGYHLVPHSLWDRYRNASPYHFPKGCAHERSPLLMELRGVWLSHQGDVLVPERVLPGGRIQARHHLISGGCCSRGWKNADSRELSIAGGCRYRLGFALAQNHGSTPWHVVHEALPRLMSFWNEADAIIRSGGVVAVRRHLVVSNFLQSLGIRPRSIAHIDNPCYFDRLLVPEAYIQGTYNDTCVSKAVARTLRATLLPREDLRRLPQRPIILLIDRAKWRTPGRCKGNRCMANLPELRDAIIREFGNAAMVETFRSNIRDIIRASAHMFHRATVVVGMHGAGLVNIVHMRGNGTSVIHLGWSRAWTMYGPLSKKFGVDFRNVFTQGAAQNCENVQGEIPVLILEIRRALERAGFQLPPPVMRTNVTRNAEVVRLYWNYSCPCAEPRPNHLLTNVHH